MFQNGLLDFATFELVLSMLLVTHNKSVFYCVITAQVSQLYRVTGIMELAINTACVVKGSEYWKGIRKWIGKSRVIQIKHE